MTIDRSEDVVSNFGSRRIMCVGDLMVDRFISGSIERISPEGPVPVLAKSSVESFAGGAANVARNIARLGGRCSLVGVVGVDPAGVELKDILLSERIVNACCIGDPERPTTQKNRFISGGQQVLRVDEELVTPVSDGIFEALLKECRKWISECDAIVISDYAKGCVSSALVSEICDLARPRNIPVIVDPKSDCFTKYDGATFITPNLKETFAATGVAVADDRAAERAGRAILAESSFEGVLITRESRGMSFVPRDGEAFHSRATAREVFDVVGAGDTAVATFALSLAAGAKVNSAVTFANRAAGIVVGKRGTATVTKQELLVEMSCGDDYRIDGGLQKIRSFESAVTRAEGWRRANLRIGFTNGCYDIIHAGHIRSLQYARANCDRLIVGLNSDASVARLKGIGRPINKQYDRAAILAALDAVDMVVVFDGDTPLRLIEIVAPDLLVKGADYDASAVVGADFVLSRGGRVLTHSLLDGRSTTNLLQKMEAGSTRAI
ncbi:D-glycero-beta-D-manno-heptose-7-phosphate kinase [Methylosinus sporium]|uniref:Bifunctional protein HldE n=1 Tax=Methylosinus sporium TaxID=428 RepID=A0A549SDI0_METSR|nr:MULTISPECIES: D-glycero-beta-D-manno-heptose-7-phosphate kinase [Methylosinus]MBU3890374.1 D-glycero-beta-D-manno-heptose-7-phosphate kinase [Methylosinus sp. KRF6]TRL26521.1 D-glycero-beta-D-manno-heptose-7-phosphate kinase [Methylosinus sporium]